MVVVPRKARLASHLIGAPRAASWQNRFPNFQDVGNETGDLQVAGFLQESLPYSVCKRLSGIYL